MLALHEVRYLAHKCLLNRKDPRAAFLLTPEKVLRIKDELFLQYRKVKQPLNVVLKGWAPHRRLVNDGLPARVRWISQYCCALEALTLLHDHGLPCGTFDENCIFFTEECSHAYLYAPCLGSVSGAELECGLHRYQ